MTLPTGEYFEDKLINLGTNRYSFTPQFGVIHTRGKWSMELSTSVSFFTDNDEFFNGVTHEEDPYLVGQGHLIYTFMPGLWLGAIGGYGYGGESTIDGASANDLKGNLGFGLSAGVSLSRNFGFKIAYIGIRTHEDFRSDNDTFTIGCSLQWVIRDRTASNIAASDQVFPEAGTAKKTSLTYQNLGFNVEG